MVCHMVLGKLRLKQQSGTLHTGSVQEVSHCGILNIETFNEEDKETLYIGQ